MEKTIIIENKFLEKQQNLMNLVGFEEIISIDLIAKNVWCESLFASNAVFEKLLKLVECSIFDELIFQSCTFSNLTIDKCTFGGKVFFDCCNFGNDFLISDSTFGGLLSFYDCTFSGKVEFQDIRMKEGTDLLSFQDQPFCNIFNIPPLIQES